MSINLSHKEFRIKEYNNNPNKCKTCGIVIPYEKRSNKFCSRSCATKYNNKFRSIETKQKISNTLKERKLKPINLNNYSYCLFCNSKINFNRKFCNNQCQADYDTKQKFDKIEQTGLFPANKNTNDTNLRNVRKYLILKYGHKCSICGLSEWMGQPIPLVADHIDGDTTNHKVENFRMVCENCNAQLPTYKSKNKYGRAWRKKYYEKYYNDEE